MDKSTFPWSLLLLCFLYVWIGEHRVFGKCSGKWAIHACRGGNGKRSDPTSIIDDTDGLEDRSRYGLEQLLLQHARNNINKEAILQQEIREARRSQALRDVYQPDDSREDEQFFSNTLDRSGAPYNSQYADRPRFPSDAMLLQKLIKLAQLKNSEEI